MATTAANGYKLYTPAQVAGISVGSSTAALILSLVVFLLYSRQRKSRPEGQRTPEHESNGLTPGTNASNTDNSPPPKITIPTPSSIEELTYLPQPTFDDELGLQASILKISITNFAYNYYRDMPPEDVVRTELNTELSESDLETILHNRRLRAQLICQYIAQQLLPSLSPFCEPEFALLPPRWVELLQTSDLHVAPTSTAERFPPYPSRARRLWWLPLWGALTAALLQSSKKPSDDVVSPVARRLAEKVERAFPCDPPENDFVGRKNTIASLVSAAAKLAITLFTHVDACDFLWLPADEVEKLGTDGEQAQQRSPRQLIVFPTLRRRKLGMDGQYGEPVVVYEAEVETLGA